MDPINVLKEIVKKIIDLASAGNELMYYAA